MGNGFDLISALPLYLELQTLGIEVHLASFSFTNVMKLNTGRSLSDTLVGLGPEDAEVPYSPESFLTHWLYEERQERVPVWCIHKTGARPLEDNYRLLVDHLGVDGILLVDGGHDSLMRGDEEHAGKLVEDALSLFVVDKLEGIKVKLLACVGMGGEPQTSLRHIFENISRLTRADALLGVCGLTRQMYAYQILEEVLTAMHNHPLQDESVVNASIVSAVRGHYGDYHLTSKTLGTKLWISALMPLYWFFDLHKVAEAHILLPVLEDTYTFNEAVNSFRSTREFVMARPGAMIPIP